MGGDGKVANGGGADGTSGNGRAAGGAMRADPVLTGPVQAASPIEAVQATMRTALPRRFYKDVATDAAPDGGHRVLLDGRPARTPRKLALLLPTAALAGAVAAEWAGQATTIDPARMPLTRLANTALDGVSGREADVRADIVRYGASDLLCYRAEHPAGLVARQREAWDPVLASAARRLGAPLAVQRGIVHVAQPAAALAGLSRAVGDLDAFALTALHTMTTLTGSALLALAVHAREITADAAWAAAHVDEDWQIAEWGEDAEAAERRRRRKREMDAAAYLLALLAGAGDQPRERAP